MVQFIGICSQIKIGKQKNFCSVGFFFILFCFGIPSDKKTNTQIIRSIKTEIYSFIHSFMVIIFGLIIFGFCIVSMECFSIHSIGQYWNKIYNILCACVCILGTKKQKKTKSIQVFNEKRRKKFKVIEKNRERLNRIFFLQFFNDLWSSSIPHQHTYIYIVH